jgi:RNase P/RNase MRP subunit p30
MSERMVEVCGCMFNIQVYKLAKNFWIAVGEHLGEHLRTRGSSAAKAVSAWRNAAEFRIV